MEHFREHSMVHFEKNLGKTFTKEQIEILKNTPASEQLKELIRVLLRAICRDDDEKMEFLVTSYGKERGVEIFMQLYAKEFNG